MVQPYAWDPTDCRTRIRAPWSIAVAVDCAKASSPCSNNLHGSFKTQTIHEGMEEVNHAEHQTCLPAMGRDKNNTRSNSSPKEQSNDSTARKHLMSNPQLQRKVGSMPRLSARY
jgi:hypothetical protein